jgi:hypothetical protein
MASRDANAGLARDSLTAEEFPGSSLKTLGVQSSSQPDILKSRGNKKLPLGEKK